MCRGLAVHRVMLIRAGAGAEEMAGALFRETGEAGARVRAGDLKAGRRALVAAAAVDSTAVAVADFTAVVVADFTAVVVAVAVAGGETEKLILRLRGVA